jgi:hypothetical protein
MIGSSPVVGSSKKMISGSRAMARASADLRAEADGAELGNGDVAGPGRFHAVALDRSERDVLPDLKRIEEGTALKQHAELAHHPAAIAVGEADHLLTIDPDRSLLRAHEAKDALQQHRLAAAGAADYDHRFLLLHVEVDALQDLLRPEGLDDAAQGDLGRRHRAKKASVMK